MENEEKKEEVVIPTVEFKKKDTGKPSTAVSAETHSEASKEAGELVNGVFKQAVVAQVQSNEVLQDELMKSAEKVVKSKTEAIKSQVELEDKVAHFNNKKGACECFGYNETTTEKWAVNVMNAWHNIMTGIWIIIGSVTFAPITFIAKKIKVIIKASWVAILLGIIIYLGFATSPLWIPLLQKIQLQNCIF